MFPLQRDDVTFGEERHVGSILYNITHEKSTPPPPGARLNADTTTTSFH